MSLSPDSIFLSANNPVPTEQTTTLTINEATELCQKALAKAGYDVEQAAIITDHLIDAELRGHTNAGLARALSITDYLQSSNMDPAASYEISRSGPSFAHLDGHDSIGYLVAREATRIAIEKAKTTGVSVVGANGLWWTGNLAYYAEMATREDLIVIIASNGTSVVAPFGGYEPKFCTNPFCIGFPTTDVDQPVIWDIGTSNIMYAQVMLADRLGASLPEGAAYDEEGNPTTEPLKALQGALTVWGGHKGSGLAMMVQLLGIAAGSSEPTPYLSGFGFLVLAFDPSILQSLDRIKKDTEKFCESIRATKMLLCHEPARMPYEKSSQNRKRAKAIDSIQVPQKIVEQLHARANVN